MFFLNVACEGFFFYLSILKYFICSIRVCKFLQIKINTYNFTAAFVILFSSSMKMLLLEINA